MLDAAVTDHTIYNLHRALEKSQASPDPSTQVGAIITTSDGHGLISWGCNTFPYGMAITRDRLWHRPTKLRLIVHAEQNAILSAARNGKTTQGGILYVACTDETGAMWGGVCTECAPEVIQAGIKCVVTFAPKQDWAEDCGVAQSWFSEAGVEYVELPNV